MYDALAEQSGCICVDERQLDAKNSNFGGNYAAMGSSLLTQCDYTKKGLHFLGGRPVKI